MTIDINDKRYATALRRGYLYGYINNEEGWSDSFVGVWVTKHPDCIKVLDIICKIENSIPTWSSFTDSFLKMVRDAILDMVSPNSARTYFAYLKAVLNDMRHQVDIPCKRYDDILKAKKVATQNIYLTEEELSRLEDVEAKTEGEKYVKCLFLVSCYTGCRHSDAMLLDKSNISGNTLSYVSQKTKIESVLPVHRNLPKMLDGYSRKIYMYDDEYNKIIRDMCQRAGINAPCKVVKGGVTKTGEKWEFVASHTARRTFASLLYLKGVDVPTIGRFMGHTGDLKMTMRYICCEKELNESQMAFFCA